ncbi:MAG: hypothetical protein Q4G26_09015 [Paracoccus sp. (in: a-proteobacteria)]|nr:hypothetical protein [Paracoccus sp. (in: a-proteobacteria)]
MSAIRQLWLRFIGFHAASVLATALILSLFLKTVLTYDVNQPNYAGAIPLALELSYALILPLLIPSWLGWWLAGAIARKMGRAPRPWLQGAAAGLFAFVAISAVVMFLPILLTGIPVGALFGWLFFRGAPMSMPRRKAQA